MPPASVRAAGPAVSRIGPLTSGPCKSRCCCCLQLRLGVLLIALLMFLAQLAMLATAASQWHTKGRRIRDQLLPRLDQMLHNNTISWEQHYVASQHLEHNIEALESGLLAVLVLSAVGAAVCPLLAAGVRWRKPLLVLAWLIWFGCMLVLGSGASLLGFIFGLVHMQTMWVLYGLGGLVAAAVFWYWYVNVVFFYQRLRPLYPPVSPPAYTNFPEEPCEVRVVNDNLQMS